MRASRAEIKIEEILQKAGVDFEEEYSFPDLVSSRGNPLRFDFCIFDDGGEIDFLVEYNGIQHYKPKSVFGGMEGLRKQVHNDTLKREYCKEHGYTLVVIPYTDESLISYDYIFRLAGY
jgi:hypothetical protein